MAHSFQPGTEALLRSPRIPFTQNRLESSLFNTRGPHQALVEKARDEFVLAGPEFLKRINFDPTRDIGGMAMPYLAIPTDIRPHHFNQLAYIEILTGWLRKLTVSDLFDNETRDTLQIASGYVASIVTEVNHLLLRGGSLPQLLLAKLQTQLWENKKAQVIRLQINMTTANGFDDHKGYVGNALKEETLTWLKANFGKINVFEDPIGTSYLIISSSLNDDRVALRNFSREVKKALLNRSDVDDLIPRKEDLVDFQPEHIACGLTLDVSDLPLNKKNTKNTATEHEVIRRIEAFLARLAASVVFLEKTTGGRIPNPLYSESDLPTMGQNPQFDALIKDRVGYVGYGVYHHVDMNGRVSKHSGLHSKPLTAEERMNLAYPSFRRLAGHLDRPSDLRGGGVVQKFIKVVQDIRGVSETDINIDAMEPLMDALRFMSVDHAAEQLVNGGLNVFLSGSLHDIRNTGFAATRDLRNPSLISGMDHYFNTDGVRENANFFAAEMALRGYQWIAIAEVNNAKARRLAYPPRDEMDGEFQVLRQVIFDTARDKNINFMDEEGNPRVIISALQGDQIIIGFDPGEDQTSQSHDKVMEFLEQSVRTSGELFELQPFQLEHKVREGQQTVRRPVWVRRHAHDRTLDSYLATQTKPEGYEAVIGHQTIAVTYYRLPGPILSQQDVDHLMMAFTQGGKFIDTKVKHAHGSAPIPGADPFPLNKEAILPLSFRPSQSSILRAASGPTRVAASKR